MGPREFDAWLGHHTALNPSMLGWIAKLTEDQQKATLAAWSRLMVGVTFSAACDATERLARAETQPRGYERHVPTICRMASDADKKADTSRRIAAFGPGTVACPDCHDLGRVHVYLVGVGLSRFLEHKRRFGSKRAPEEATALVRCDCSAGAAYSYLPAIDRDGHKIAVRGVGVQLRDDPGLMARRRDEVDQAEAMAIGGEA